MSGFLVAACCPSRQYSRARCLWAALVQAVASVLSIAAAIGVQYFIMHRMYPDAPRQVAALQLFSNLKLWLNYFVVAAALFPWWITLAAGDAPLACAGWLVGWGSLIGSVVHFALFYILGIAWEVRIFLPFAMTLVPLTVTLGLRGDLSNQPRPSAGPTLRLA